MGSHQIRTESNCLNCGNEVNGSYCSNCGQKNVEIKLSFWQLITHFLADLFHYDGKFLLSIKYLITRPGYLSIQWSEGKRASFLDPFKFYIFGSAIFFFSLSVFFNTSNKKLDVDVKTEVVNNSDTVMINNVPFTSFDEYLAYQQTLSSDKQDNWLEKKVNERNFRFNELLKEKGTSALKYIVDLYLKYLPYMLFICLPIFAGVLKLLYYRHKNYFYSDHGIFTMHLVLFMFLVMIVSQILNSIPNSWVDILVMALNLFAIFNIYKAFKNFYKQSRAKTILKNILFYILSFVVLFVVFSGGVIVLLLRF